MNFKHGMCRTPEYGTWVRMIRRCTDPNLKHYKDYGGRGISVCERWRVLDNFLADVGVRPKGTSLDRINNDGNYEPENCRWATHTDQMRNKRSNVLISLNGKTQCVAVWAKELGILDDTIRWRLKRGWPADRVLSKNFRPQYRT